MSQLGPEGDAPLADLEGFDRYAIYFAPAAPTPLADFGAAWLGRGPDGAARPRLVVDGLPEALEALTPSARRYGFHATLKAPFALAAGHDARGLDRALHDFAAARPAADGPPLRLSTEFGFVCLRPDGPSPSIDALAAEVMMRFDAFRAPLTEAALEKRRASALSPRQEALLVDYGYPYVLDEFRFHMTLTKPLAAVAAAAVAEAIGPRLAPILAAPLRIDTLRLFGERDPGDGFVELASYPLRHGI